MAKTMPINADGASNALQAWEMSHGNPLLRGWTVTDVSFYSTELMQYALIELVYGLHENVFRIAAAMTYALLVVLAAMLAKGNATGLAAWTRMGVAVAIMLLPMPGNGYLVAFGGPNHVGTGVPLLLTWLVLDRASGHRKWLPAALTALLAWGQIGDPLVLFIGVFPLAAVSAYRVLRSRDWRGLDGQLVIAAAASVVIGQGFLKLVAAAGGFVAHSPPTEFSSISKWGSHLRLLAEVTAVNYGGYLPDMDGPVEITVGLIRLVGLALACAALVYAVVQIFRSPDGDRVNQILAVAILVNLAAFIASTLPTDLMSARQVSVVLPMGAALAGRVCTTWLAPRRLAIPLAAVLVFFSAVFVAHALVDPRPEPKREITAWLDSKNLRHGLGGYWNSNDLSLISGGRVMVIPVIDRDEIKGYRWESRAQWYDPSRYDARFVIIDVDRPGYGTVATALKQFGRPVERRDFGQFAVLVYDHNLLVGLKAACGGKVASSMAECAA